MEIKISDGWVKDKPKDEPKVIWKSELLDKENSVLQEMIDIPVEKPTPLVQCGTDNTVYPPNKPCKEKENDRKSIKSIGKHKQWGGQQEPWET